MKKIVIAVIIIIVIAVGIWAYLAWRGSTGTNATAPNTNPTSTQAYLPTVAASSSAYANLPDYMGTASQVFGSSPTGTTLTLNTPQGAVMVNNFYLENPPVVEGGSAIIAQASGYIIDYDRLQGAFWIGVSAPSFDATRPAAEQAFLSTLGVSSADACKLDVTEGVIYSPGNPLDGESFPLSFCQSSGFAGQ